jgi:hypothetical protein
MTFADIPKPALLLLDEPSNHSTLKQGYQQIHPNPFQSI